MPQTYRSPDSPSPDRALPTIPDVVLHQEIARGGMGVVYRGRQAFLDRDVAVKLLAEHLAGEQFAARFRREAKLLAGIKHPHIVACHTAGTTAEGQSYLVMEFVDGPNLKTWIAEHGAVPTAAALRLARLLGSALAHAADLGVIHRDVKPENVLLEAPTSTAIDLTFPYEPKLVDLGLARMTYETGDLGLTRPGAVMGTLGTMAPEQLDAPDTVDFRADIYGLGCVLYHMLAGLPAFASTKLTEVVAEKRARAPDPCAKNPTIPGAVGRLVAAMLAPDRDERPASYRELAARLDELLAVPAHNAPPPATAKVPRAPSRLLQTAEIDFLNAGGLAALGRASGNVADAFLAASEPLAKQAPIAGAAPTAPIGRAPSRATKPAVKHAPELIGGPPAKLHRSHRLVAFVAAAAGILLVAMPALRHPQREPTPPMPDHAITTAPQRVMILVPEGPLRPHTPIELQAETTPAAAVRYRWSIEPEAGAHIAAAESASTTLRLAGLPGDAFTVHLEADANGSAPLFAERQLVLDFPPADLGADFLEHSTESPLRGRFRGDWSRRPDDGAIVCVAPDAPCIRTRSIIGNTWRLAGQVRPERHNRRAFPQTAVCLRIGPGRQLALVAEREGESGENWTLSLQEIEREEGRGSYAFRPFTQPQTVIAVDRDGRLAAATFTITRRGGDVEIKFGFPNGASKVHKEHVRAGADTAMLTLFAKGGRGVFGKLQLW